MTPRRKQTSPTEYQQIIRGLSDRIVEAQTPIRVLDAIKWDDGIRDDFLKGRGKHAPKVDRSYYDGRPLAFDASAKKQEFQNIERDITRHLGQFNPVGQIMRRMCKEYRMVIRMLEARGTQDFGLISQELYGSASDAFHAGDPTLADLGLMLSDYLNNIADRGDLKDEPKTLTATQVVGMLQERLNKVFDDKEDTIRVFESDGIVADAAAGADYIKVRADALFNERDVRALEVHEGLVHVGTTLNGLNQPICTFLAKGPPSSTVTQEGLAILMEVIAFASYPTRLRKLTNRTRAIHMAEEGADFLEVFHFYREQGYSMESSYQNSSRVFRGSTPAGLPFTKDLSYLKGFILIYNYIQLAVRKGKLEQIPLLFCGKATLEDMRTLRQLVDEGLVVPPKYLPPQFRDLNALSAWMCFSNFLNHLSLDRIEADYANIL
ncbi:flavohemoglobin expression-modulating QEGLA motif protein [Pseudomonas sp. NY15181]|uniref:flavohemoglobin expression-modulating QEGLA motif protein n=1 Tax=Pseudomonas sp. NY15181 TaxID=3400349 RepID=UPI003A896070